MKLRTHVLVVAMLIIAVFDGLLVRWQLDPGGAPSASRLVGAAQGAVVALTRTTGSRS